MRGDVDLVGAAFVIALLALPFLLYRGCQYDREQHTERMAMIERGIRPCGDDHDTLRCGAKVDTAAVIRGGDAGVP